MNFSPTGVHDFNKGSCMTWDEVLLYQSTLTTISKLSWTQLVNRTGCHAKCTWNRYSFNKVEWIYSLSISTSGFYRLVRKLYTGRHFHLPASSYQQRRHWWRLRKNCWHLTMRILSMVWEEPWDSSSAGLFFIFFSNVLKWRAKCVVGPPRYETKFFLGKWEHWRTEGIILKL